MPDPVQLLKDLQPQHEFFIGIDSDGCAFDSMELKHKECFCPNFIKHFGLQAVSKYARETWDFVNLYSKTRGYNRFKAVLAALELLRERPEVQARGVQIPEMQGWRSGLAVKPNWVILLLRRNCSRIPTQTLNWRSDGLTVSTAA